VIDSGVTVKPDGKWVKKGYPDWMKFVRTISQQELLVGGFHFDDCVVRFAGVARQAGRQVKVSPLISDLYYSEYCSCRLLGFGNRFRLPLPMAIDPEEFEARRAENVAKWRERLSILFEP